MPEHSAWGCTRCWCSWRLSLIQIPVQLCRSITFSYNVEVALLVDILRCIDNCYSMLTTFPFAALLIYLLGVMLPFYGSINALIGAVSTPLVSFCLPCLAFNVVIWNKRKRQEAVYVPFWYVPSPGFRSIISSAGALSSTCLYPSRLMCNTPGLWLTAFDVPAVLSTWKSTLLEIKILVAKSQYAMHCRITLRLLWVMLTNF